MDYGQKRTIALKGLFILACFYTLYFARAVFLPIVVAILLNFLLAPFVRALKKIHIHESISAFVLILVFLGAIAYGFYNLSNAARQWLAQEPQNFEIIYSKIELLKKPVESSIKGFFNIRQQIENSGKMIGAQQPAVVTVKSTDNSIFNWVFASTSEFLTQLGLIFFILYFLLASGDFFLKKIVEILPSMRKKKEAIIIAREIKDQITNFLVVKTLTGIGLAVVIAMTMYVLKMPYPILWGVMAGVFEFFPYIGVVVGTILCTLTALFVFNDLNQIILAPLSFFLITSATGNFIVPLILSRSLALHPVIVFVSVIFGGWMWGVVGALIAIPLLSILKIFCNNIHTLESLGKFLGE